jgi:hypothetical protein
MQLEKELWLVDQLTVLAEAFGESSEKMSPQRLQIYTGDLADLNQDQLKLAFTRARRECKFFPKIAELRELAGAGAEHARRVEAAAAWNYVHEYLRQWGVERMPFYKSGQRIDPPTLPPRIAYALRRIGGLRGLNQVSDESRPFMYKDFCQAYELAPTAEQLEPQLQGMFGAQNLLAGTVKQLSTGRPMELASTPGPVQSFKPKSIPEPLTDAQIRDRRQMLKRQAALAMSAPKNS